MFIKVTHQNQTQNIKIDQLSSMAELNNAIMAVFTNLPPQFRLKANISNSQQVLNDNDFLQLKKQNHHMIQLSICDNQGNLPQLQPTQKLQSEQHRFKELITLSNNQNSFAVNQQNHPPPTQQLVAQSQPQPQPMFTCILCDVSQKDGVFFRCSVCPDVDLCVECQQICSHDHPFMKIKDTKFKNLRIFAVLEAQLQRTNVQQPISIEEQLIQQRLHKKQEPIFGVGAIKKSTEKITSQIGNLKNYFMRGLHNKFFNKAKEAKQKQDSSNDEQENQPKVGFDF